MKDNQSSQGIILQLYQTIWYISRYIQEMTNNFRQHATLVSKILSILPSICAEQFLYFALDILKQIDWTVYRFITSDWEIVNQCSSSGLRKYNRAMFPHLNFDWMSIIYYSTNVDTHTEDNKRVRSKLNKTINLMRTAKFEGISAYKGAQLG